MEGASVKIAARLLQFRTSDPDVAQLTTGMISRETGASRATVVRFCRSLGYAGFPEFKSALIQELSYQQPQPAEEGANLSKVARRVMELSLDSIYGTLRALDPDAFEAAVAALCRAAVIVWFGYPCDAACLAAMGANKMNVGGRRAQAVDHERELLALSETVAPNNALVLVTQSGRWQAVADAIPAFKKKGCTIVVITSAPGSKIGRQADIILTTSMRDISFGTHPIGMRSAQVLVVDMLTVAAIDRLQSVPIHFEEPKLSQLRSTYNSDPPQ